MKKIFDIYFILNIVVTLLVLAVTLLVGAYTYMMWSLHSLYDLNLILKCTIYFSMFIGISLDLFCWYLLYKTWKISYNEYNK